MAERTFLEEFIAFLNADVFLREFAFSRTRFTPPSGSEIELADHVVRIDDLVFLYQLKERSGSATSGVDDWITNKVVKKATRQIRDTMRLLGCGGPIMVPNERGHAFDLASRPEDRVLRLVLFKTSDTATPLPCPRYHVSKTAGFIHLIDGLDYLGICQILITPAEIAGYLEWRERMLQEKIRASLVSEEALVGQYLMGPEITEPDERFQGALAAMVEDRENFDLSYLLNHLGAHVADASTRERETSYYPILRTLAKLHRTELRALKERFRKALDALKDNRIIKPVGFYLPGLDCGFLLIPLPTEQFERRLQILDCWGTLDKHRHKARTEIAMSLVRKGEADLLIDWSYASSPWVKNPGLDAALAIEGCPLRPVREQRVPRYTFSIEELERRGVPPAEGP